MKKKVVIAVFASDVGFGHMVRQREIIFELIKKIKDCKITIFNNNNINLFKKVFNNKVDYYKKFNNIQIFNSHNGILNKKKDNFF